MAMAPRAAECLEQDDIRQFFRGACHVFAIACQEFLPTENYEVIRVAVGPVPAYHVYVKREGVMVDIGGFKCEADYHAWLFARENEFECFRTTKEEILAIAAADDPEDGAVNVWGLFVDPQFIERATCRAKPLLESARYKASLVFEGRRRLSGG